jgi:hypothetical protein
LDLTRINDMPFYHCEEFASANDVVISINRLAVILRPTKEDEGSHCLFECYQRVSINREHATLRRDSSVASLLQNDVPFDIVIPADII